MCFLALNKIDVIFFWYYWMTSMTHASPCAILLSVESLNIKVDSKIKIYTQTESKGGLLHV